MQVLRTSVTYLDWVPGITYSMSLKTAQPANVLKENIIKQKYINFSACQRQVFIRAQNKAQFYLSFLKNKAVKQSQ